MRRMLLIMLGKLTVCVNLQILESDSICGGNQDKPVRGRAKLFLLIIALNPLNHKTSGFHLFFPLSFFLSIFQALNQKTNLKQAFGSPDLRRGLLFSAKKASEKVNKIKVYIPAACGLHPRKQLQPKHPLEISSCRRNFEPLKYQGINCLLYWSLRL